MKEEGQRRQLEPCPLSIGHGKGLDSYQLVPAILSLPMSSECRLVPAQGWGRRTDVPFTLHPGRHRLTFLVLSSFVVEIFHFNFSSTDSLQLQLFSDEDGDEEEKYLPEFCKHYFFFQQTHTQGQYSLRHIAKPFVNTRLLSNCTLLGS